ncbi:MAG: BamA/TamA family outer membrane protein, partial [Myxococcales bacterium]|nr:BamA/TamA family outer membrane protein [Myxococcales bacterium]
APALAPAPEHETGSEPGAESETGPGPQAESETGPQAEPEPESESVSEPAPGSVSEPESESESVSEPAPASAEPEALTGPAARITYTLERVEIRGNVTQDSAIRRYITLSPGDLLDVDDPAIERIRWRLMGTGWFHDVRLQLERGGRRGWVVLVVEVEERNTLTISRVVAGLTRVVTDNRSRDDKLRPYAGLGLTESNLFGLGIGVGLSGVISDDQRGVDLRYRDPMLLGGGFDLRGRLFYNDARDFFGRRPNVDIECPEPDPDEEDPDPCDPDVLRKRAVVVYERAGIGFGGAHDLTSTLRFELDWLGELVDVEVRPTAASTAFGRDDEQRAPIDFRIDDGVSHVSSVHIGFIHDARDDPALPSRGQLLRLDARIASGLIGSTYDFARYEATFHHYQRLPWGHVLDLGAFLGAVVGQAPFFYHFYAADLSDLLPSRVLGLRLDHRRTHNLLETSIQEFDKENLAARVDFEYMLPLHRGGGDVRGIDAYAGAGLFLLADRDKLRAGIPGYTGAARLPVDVTFDLGIQADTTLGLFKVGFSSLIGFLPDLRRDP